MESNAFIILAVSIALFSTLSIIISYVYSYFESKLGIVIGESPAASKSKIPEVLNQTAESEKEHELLDDFQFIETSMIRSRLVNEIKNLQLRSKTSLLAAISIAITGLIIIVFLFFYSKFERNENSFLTIDFLTRLSIFILIQIIMFFFLRQYRLHQDEIKFYNNELVSIDSKVIATKIALRLNDKQLIDEVVKSLLSYDKNHRLGSGETTTYLKLNELNSSPLNDLLSNHIETLKLLINSAGKK